MANPFTRFGRLLSGESRGNPLENPAVPLSAAPGWLFDLFGGTPSAAGVSVNAHTAMQYTAVYACINVLASAFSSLPCEVLEHKGTSKTAAYDNDLYYLLAVEPNPDMSAVSFWGALIACAALHGNGYALILRDGAGAPEELWPLLPHYVAPKRNKTTKLVEYHVTVDGETTIYKSSDILHVPALTLDGIVGMDPIRAASNSIGTGIAAGRHIGGFFGRGSRPSGVLTRAQATNTPSGTLQGKTAPEKNDGVRESWEKANSGENQGRTAVLPYGWDWKAISITPEQAQFLEIMQYTRTEIAGLWQIPPHMIGDTSRLSNANGQSEAQNFLNFTLRPWIVRVEMEAQRKLIGKPTRKPGPKTARLIIRFDTTEMLRLDFASQITAISMGRQWGLYTANEGRAKLGDNPIEGEAGNQYLVPLNMVLAASLGKDPETAKPADPDAGTTDPNLQTGPDDVPAGNGGQNQRKLMDRMADAYRPLFRDAAGRLQSRGVRNADTVQHIFGPLLQSIAEESERQARGIFRLPAEQDLGTEKLLRETAKQLERRTALWTATTAATDVDAELKYCVRAIALNVFREAGSTIAQAA